MKKYRFIILWLFILPAIISVSSCEKVINVDLNNGKETIVIEANVTSRVEKQIVKVSHTKPFTEDNSFAGISNATVIIKDEVGTQFQLTQTSQGIYQSTAFAGVQGRKYTVEVRANNNVYTASSVMPKRVSLDSLTLSKLTFLNESRKYVRVNFKDPANIANQYNYVVSVNGKIRNSFYVDSDRFNDGNVVSNTIFVSEPELIMGDKVEIDFQCIDANVYRYFFAISQISGNGGPPTAPANPTSNFDNGALGYFSAHTSQRASIVIQ